MALSYTRGGNGAWMRLIDNVLIVLRETHTGVQFVVWCGEEEPVHKGTAPDFEEAKRRVWCWLEAASAVGLFGLQA
jgi:hypothetical protein